MLKMAMLIKWREYSKFAGIKLDLKALVALLEPV
jgi:hypothetical protein